MRYYRAKKKMATSHSTHTAADPNNPAPLRDTPINSCHTHHCCERKSSSRSTSSSSQSAVLRAHNTSRRQSQASSAAQTYSSSSSWRQRAAHYARSQNVALRMSTMHVLAFVGCWTPYLVISLWHIFDSQSVDSVSPEVQDALFLTAVFNSCINPIVYGGFYFTALKRRRAKKGRNGWSVRNRQESGNQLTRQNRSLLALSPARSLSGNVNQSQGLGRTTSFLQVRTSVQQFE